MKNDLNIELRSQEVQEIMGRIPSMIERIGITVLFVFVIASLCFCALVKYPEHLEIKASNYTIKKYETEHVNVLYLLKVGLEEKTRISKNMDVSLKLGKENFLGKVVCVSSQFDQQTGLFNVYVRANISKEELPLVLQYKDATTISINIANKTILQKILER